MAEQLLRPSESDAPHAIHLFEAIGGSAKCREISAEFYARVDQDPTLSSLFPGKTHKCAIEEMSAFLVQFLGGPSKDAQRRWWLSLQESHLRLQIGLRERNAWIEMMTGTLRDVEMNQSMRSALTELFEEASAYLVNTGPAAATTAQQLKPSDVHAQFQNRWEQQRELDNAVAAIRAGELDQLTALVEGPLLQSLLRQSRSVFAQFVGVLIGSGQDVMAEYAQQTLQANPDLANEFYSGLTLLHAASAAGNLRMAAELLKLGVDPNIQDSGGHTPLYSVGNQCGGGAAVVRALIRDGARVDDCDGSKRCTALHMAARRGNVEVAEALLECGANIEAHDSLGETPLRRAVNCGRIGVAALLLAKGADPFSVGSKGLTPQSAARTRQMQSLFQARVNQ